MLGLAMDMGSMLSPEAYEKTIVDRFSDTKLGEQADGAGWRHGEGNEEYSTHLDPVVPEAPGQDFSFFKKGASGLKSRNTDAV